MFGTTLQDIRKSMGWVFGVSALMTIWKFFSMIRWMNDFGYDFVQLRSLFLAYFPALAMVNTWVATACATMSWMLAEWVIKGKPSMLGAASGAVAGLVAITPAAGFVSPIMGIPIGIIVTLICFYAMRLRSKTKTDDSLDVFACHGMGGTWGCLATGIFASTALTPHGGLFNGGAHQVLLQLVDMAVVWVWSFGWTWIIAKILDKTMGLRVSETEESVGLDISQQGERAYGEE